MHFLLQRYNTFPVPCRPRQASATRSAERIRGSRASCARAFSNLLAETASCHGHRPRGELHSRGQWGSRGAKSFARPGNGLPSMKGLARTKASE